MHSTSLKGLSINYVDSLGFEDFGFTFWMKVATTSEILKIRFNGLIHLNFSRDWMDEEPEDIGIFEIEHDYRKLVSSDLISYGYSVEDPSKLPKLISSLSTQPQLSRLFAAKYQESL